MPKYSQLPNIQNIISSDYLTILHDGVVYKIRKSDLLADYYTKEEVLQLIENITGGGIPWQEKVYADQSITGGVEYAITHNCNNINFRYDYLEWNSTLQEYLRVQMPLQETGRTSNELRLYSLSDIPKFKLVIFG